MPIISFSKIFPGGSHILTSRANARLLIGPQCKYLRVKPFIITGDNSRFYSIIIKRFSGAFRLFGACAKVKYRTSC